MDNSLHRLLATLRSGEYATPERGAFTALPAAEGSGHLLAIDTEGAPSLLLRAKHGNHSALQPLRLQGLAIQHGIRCQVTIGGGEARDETFTTLSCTSENPLEQEYFLHAADLILRIVGGEPGADQLASAASHLASLFQRLSRPPRQSVTGIMGELMLIARAASPELAVQSWRCDTTDRYDFVCGSLRLEVKATERRERAHHLSYEQCHPPEGTTGLLASLIIEPAGGGTSLGELIEAIATRLAGSLPAILRLNEVVADTLGQALPAAVGERFDRQLAETSLSFFDLRTIPAIRHELPPAVTDVRFVSHLDRAPTRGVGAAISLRSSACLAETVKRPEGAA